MRIKLSLLLITFYHLLGFSQVDVKTVKPENDTITHWKKTNRLGLDLTEVAYVNWSAGGNNSISGLFNAAFSRKYKKKLLFWNNELFVTYGINKQQDREIRKTEDALRINSTFGFKKDSLSKIYYSSKLNFNTQFYYGYQYPNTDVVISEFMSPGYLFLGTGVEYINKPENLNIYASPLTLKSTFVLNQRLANEGAFGVTGAVYDKDGNLIREGKKVNAEFGALISLIWAKEVYKNMHLNNRLRLYTDYFRDFGNIDIDWEMNFNLIVNKYVKANIGTHLIYDDHIKHQEDTDGDGELEASGPRVQFKQLLGVGLVYDF